MAEDKGTELFTEKARNKLRSPDDLSEYLRVTNASGWIVLTICAILLFGLFTWGVVETAETNVTTFCANVGGKVICFLPVEQAAKIRVGDPANVEGHLLKVASTSSLPISRDDANELLDSSYLVKTLVSSDWSIVVVLKGDDVGSIAEGIPLSVTITTERVAPLSLVFGGDGQ